MTKFTKTLLATSILLCFSASSYAATGADNDYFGEKLTVDGKTVDSVDFTQNKYEIGSSDTNDVVITSTADNKYGLSLRDENRSTKATILGKNISISSEKDRGVDVKFDTNLLIGDETTETINITGATYGVTALQRATATLQAKEVNIVATAEKGTALHVQNNSDTKGTATVSIKADNVNLKGYIGVSAMSEAVVDIDANTYIEASSAILARGDAIVTINDEGTHVVQIDGNLNFNYDEGTSGTSVNAFINLNLSGSNSYWKGNTLVSWDSRPDDSQLDVRNVTLKLSNGAQWIPTKIENNDQDQNGSRYTNLNNLTLAGGVVTIEDVDQKVHVDNLTGEGTVNVATKLNDDGSFGTSKLMIGEGKSTLNVNYNGINADQISNAEEAFKSLEGAIQTGTATVSQVQNIAEGDVSGAYTNDGGKITQAKNTKLDAFGSVAALNAVAWRHELNSVSKRMGELRDAPEGVGAWARLYGSEMEYGDQNIESQNTTIQIGSDYKIGQWTVGATVGYTDGESDYDRGSSDNEAWNFGVYGTWFAENGQYVDLIAKYSRLSQDFKLDTMKGDYDNNAFVISAEYGWHLPVMEIGFIEPQVELTYGRIMGEDFTTSNGVEIEQDDFDSFIGRLGVRAGIKCPGDWGTVYARASVVHDFDGEFDATARSLKTSATADIYEDLGGTWGEFGIGANINFTKNTYMYVDAEITSGGEVDENYRWNIGVRHNF